MDERLAGIRRVFEQEADDWHDLTRKYQTRYDEMIAEVLWRTRVGPGGDVLDLGSGSGVVAELLLEQDPTVRVTLLDLSGAMLRAAERRLARFSSRIELVQGTFADMPDRPYDAVVSALALHHIGTDEEKRETYGRIFEGLRPGGSFWQAEYVLASRQVDSDHNEELWAAWLRGEGFDDDEVRALQQRVRANDRPATLMGQLEWLRDCGFEDVDCAWRYGKFSVFGGWKR